jgi:hypothetical protein
MERASWFGKVPRQPPAFILPTGKELEWRLRLSTHE